MTDTTSTPPATSPPPPREAGLFRWIRGLGIVRGNRWMGGVCGGIAARLGIDPLLVRGLFVVAALVGFPAIAIYLVCWVLLPDMVGRIPLQQLARRPIGPFVITLGALVVGLFGLLFLVTWYHGGGSAWWLFGGWWWPFFGLDGFGAFVSFLVGLAFAAGFVVLVVKLSTGHHASRPVPPDAPQTPAPADDSGTSSGWGGRDAAPPSGALPAPADERGAASPLSSDTSPGELAHWRMHQEEWRTQHDAWRRQQADADAAAREQLRREREEQGRAFALAAQERVAERRRTRPRTSALYVVGVIGAALVAGAVTALTVTHLGAAVACGAALLVGAIVCATGMAVAGILRRRSGFLTFVMSALMVSGLIVGYLGIVVPDGWDLVLSTSSSAPQSYRQAFGATTITVTTTTHPDARVSIEKAQGGVVVYLEPGAVVALEATLGDGNVYRQVLATDSTPETPTRVIPATSSDSTSSTYSWSNAHAAKGRHPVTGTPVSIDLQHGDVFIYETEKSK